MYNDSMNTSTTLIELSFSVGHWLREHGINNLRLPSGKKVAFNYTGYKIGHTCYLCGVTASKWVLIENVKIEKKGKKEKKHTHRLMQLVAVKNGKYVTMTRDHIIPRSLGGRDRGENYRTVCQPCNVERGTSLDVLDLLFISEHPHLVDPKVMYQKLVKTYVACKVEPLTSPHNQPKDHAKTLQRASWRNHVIQSLRPFVQLGLLPENVLC